MHGQEDVEKLQSEVYKRRDRLYQSYASTHAGTKEIDQEALVFRSEILPRLPKGNPAVVRAIDVGCGQGHLVRQLQNHGFTAARGIDVSPEQVAIANGAGIAGVECGDYQDLLRNEAGELDVVIATDFIEHFTKNEVLSIFDDVRAALKPGGLFIIRTPNAVSPFFGHYQFGDFTHESAFTPGSFKQIALNAGFSESLAFPTRPVGHGARGLLRKIVWSGVAGMLLVALAAETGGRGHIVSQNFIGVAIV